MSSFLAKKYGHLLTGGTPYFVEGLVAEDVGRRVYVDGEEGRNCALSDHQGQGVLMKLRV
ncbi:MAG: hypothetical protein O2999_11250 [Nitrospirae bacterium]|nr:hypothetical protein [Nitrospirota bacterium]MDA1304855.1 hypothetical protein [Nitrospirota bacterium]